MWKDRSLLKVGIHQILQKDRVHYNICHRNFNSQRISVLIKRKCQCRMEKSTWIFMYLLILFNRTIFLLIVYRNKYMPLYSMVCFSYICAVEFFKGLQGRTRDEYGNVSFSSKFLTKSSTEIFQKFYKTRKREQLLIGCSRFQLYRILENYDHVDFSQGNI